MQLIVKFVREANRKEIMAVVDNKVFDEEENRVEVVALLTEFVKLKRNNNIEKTIE